MRIHVKDRQEIVPLAHKKRAVVLRIDSPGGTVTASEELYQKIVNLTRAADLAEKFA